MDQATSRAPPTSPSSSIAAFLNALWLIRPKPTNPDFDAGINTSSAWTGSLSPEGAVRSSASLNVNLNSLSDDEPESDADPSDDHPDLGTVEGRPARALFAFEGKPEFRELTNVLAGDELEILKEEVGDGWSLVKHLESKDSEGIERRQEVGLLPQTYYTYTSEFAQAPDLELPSGSHIRARSRQEASSSSITPRGSPSRQPQPLPIVPQTTGEWFPSFRRSLLGGKRLNRFSTFVTSGAEEWVLKGSTEDPQPIPRHERDFSTASIGGSQPITSGMGEADRHFVDVGPTWKTKVPPFRVLVHSPSKRTSLLSGAYTVYTVTSLFDNRNTTMLSPASSPGSNSSIPLPPDTSDDLTPPSSPVRITVHRRFSHFVVLHTALTRRLPGIALPPLPEKQYAGRFNDDFVEARRGDLERYLSRVVRHPLARYAEVLTFFLGCESDTEWKKQYPSFLSMPPAGPAFYAHVYHPAFNLDTDDAEDSVDRLTKAMQKTTEVLQSVADIYDDHARRTQLVTHENLKGLAHPSAIYAVNRFRTIIWTSTEDVISKGVVDTHRSTLSRFNEATGRGVENEEMAARCETVLNTTMAEIETYHSQKIEDFQTLTKDHLDSEIEFHEQILGRLKSARRTFDAPQYTTLSESPRQPSIFERELEHPRLNPPSLTQPCPHVYDSAPMRPVSVAIQEGVGMLLRTSQTRGSVLGRFW
ncbi:hypothetical protein NLI96_g9314 [Meripilus lineatus]|uniref:PX-domain-containing protein n=1 Tax=Meripilus lineatus TaxID=2056292 RepID=A0AAD5V0X1_9APHY|nr:hypothetical protein NLI96_g9314 [Physisporinus lineatus]